MAIQATEPADSSPRLPSRMKKPRRGVWVLAALGSVLLALFSLVIYFWLLGPKAPFNGPTWTVKREKLVLTIVERGSLESADNKDSVCRVKAKSQTGIATTIKWLVEDGTYVKGGEPFFSIYSNTLGMMGSPCASPLCAAAGLRPGRHHGDQLIELDDSTLQE